MKPEAGEKGSGVGGQGQVGASSEDGALLSVTEQGGGSCQLAFLSHSRNVTARHLLTWTPDSGRLDGWMDGWNTGREREGQGGQGMLGPPASCSADLGRGPVMCILISSFLL